MKSVSAAGYRVRVVLSDVTRETIKNDIGEVS